MYVNNKILIRNTSFFESQNARLNLNGDIADERIDDIVKGVVVQVDENVAKVNTVRL